MDYEIVALWNLLSLVRGQAITMTLWQRPQPSLRAFCRTIHFSMAISALRLPRLLCFLNLTAMN